MDQATSRPWNAHESCRPLYPLPAKVHRMVSARSRFLLCAAVTSVYVACASEPSPPATPSVRIEPAVPLTGDPLRVLIDPLPGEQLPDFDILWRHNGTDRSEIIGDTVPAGTVHRGDRWTAVVTPRLGTRSGPPAEAEVNVANSPPAVSVTLTPDAPSHSTALEVVSTAMDRDGDVVTLSVQWFLNGTPYPASGNIIAGESLKGGQQWRVEVTPNDGTDTGASATASTQVVNSAPQLSGLLLTPVVPSKAAPLTATATASDPDGDEITIEYTWRVNGIQVMEAVGGQLGPTHFSKGQTVSVETVAKDGTATSNSKSASTVIENAVPVAPGLAYAPNQPHSGSPIAVTCPQCTDPDGDALSYQWSVTGRPLNSTAQLTDTSSTTPSFVPDIAGTYTFKLLISDGAASTTIEVGLDVVPPPTAPSTPVIFDLSPATCSHRGPSTCSTESGITTCHTPCLSAYTLAGTQVTCSAAGSTDPNGDPVSYSYTWVKVGTSVSTSGQTLPAGASVPGDKWECIATATDGALSSAITSAQVAFGTSVAGQIISAPTTWTLSGSPYFLAGTLFIDSPASLTVEAGVSVIGGTVEVLGQLLVRGSAQQPVELSSVRIVPRGLSSSQPHLMDIQYARISGGSLYAPTGNGSYGALLLRDSVLTNLTDYVYLWYPTSPSVLERNVIDGLRISIGTSGSGSAELRNNLFRGGASIDVWAAYSTPVLVEKNSFPSTGGPHLRFDPIYTAAYMNAVGNYWGGAADADVPSLIFDKLDNPSCASVIPFLPTLAAPDPATPTSP